MTLIVIKILLCICDLREYRNINVIGLLRIITVCCLSCKLTQFIIKLESELTCLKLPALKYLIGMYLYVSGCFICVIKDHFSFINQLPLGLGKHRYFSCLLIKFSALVIYGVCLDLPCSNVISIHYLLKLNLYRINGLVKYIALPVGELL